MSSASAYFATVLRLTPSLRAISALGTPEASIFRISCLVSGGTVILTLLPAPLAKANAPGGNIRRGRAPCGARPSLLIKLLSFR